MSNLFPKIKGALVGGITSTLFVGWISLGTQAAMLRGDIVVTPKPVDVSGCAANYTLPVTPASVEFDRYIFMNFLLLFFTNKIFRVVEPFP